MKRVETYGIFFLITFISIFSFAQNKKIDLSGRWKFDIDKNDVGIKEKWFGKQLSDDIYLPGSMAENRKGDDVTLNTQWTASIYDSTFFYNPRLKKYREPDNLKIPFWLTPVKYYVGAAWYQKEVVVPENWKNTKVILFLERPHYETRLWINTVEAGIQNSLSVPHQFDIGKYLKKGKNTITLCVDNRTKDINVGKDSHSITDQTQGNWNGIVGKIELQSMPISHIQNIQVFPDITNKKAVVRLKINGKSDGIVTLKTESFNSKISHKINAVSKPFQSKGEETLIEMEIPMGDNFLTWNEFHPNLYRLSATLKTKQGSDEYQTHFGMRDFNIKGKYFYVNGQKTLLRGTVENCNFPLTGYAPMDETSWIRVFRICKSFGLNHMRFHSYCPPQAAFDAADKVGFYIQPEGPSWPNHGSSLGNGEPVDDYLWQEAESITEVYGNSPSFCMFAIGNEPRGRWVPWVTKFVNHWKEKDRRRVYTGASVGGSWAWQPGNQFHVKAGARGLDWNRRPESESDYRHKIDTVGQPYVSHETGQWCVFPDFTEIQKYTGVMKARNFELFRQDLKDRHMGDMSQSFLMSSGKLQALCYKNEIEKTLRTPDYAGFQLLALNDYSGQGTALVGVLNVFWQEKGYINAEEFRRFCAPMVLLSRMEKFVFENKENLNASIEIAHFGEKPLKNQVVRWRIKDEFGGIVSEGKLLPKDIEIGNCQTLGTITYPLSSIAKAGKFNLEVSLNKTDVSNNWDFWVYPSELSMPDTTNIYISETVDEKAKDVLDKGGKVLLLLAGKITQGKDVVQYMTPAFWNTSWFKMRPPHTVGTYINNFHPVFKDFPTDDFQNLQWWELVNRQQTMELTDFPADFQPIVQTIDTWFINRKLGMLFETNVGRGKIMVCSADLRSKLDERPVAKQLLYSILNYMNSDIFFPELSVKLSTIDNLTKKRGETLDFDTKDAPDELKNKVL
ncbi:MAG: sugar-binding domain-containing protein [Paludibacteraceae bacterium]